MSHPKDPKRRRQNQKKNKWTPKNATREENLRKNQENWRKKNNKEIFHPWYEILLGLSTPEPRGMAQ